MIGANPFDWPDGPFLALYAILLLGSFVASFAIAMWLRPEGRTAFVSDEDELALLAGGRTRFGETVLARLFARDAISLEKGGIQIDPTAVGASPAESDLLALQPPFRWKAVRAVLAGASADLEQRLVGRQLLTDPDEARQLGLFAALPFALLIAFGLARLLAGIVRDEAVGLLVAAVVMTALIAAYRVAVFDRRTRAGIAAVSDARERHERLGRAPTRDETGMAVALFGTAVLVGSPLAELHGIRRDKGDGGSGCGSSGCGGNGNSGCGGGGCGGCGG